MPARKLLVVQNIECETLGILEKMFRSDGFGIDIINAQNEPVPTTSDEHSAMVILGGPLAAYDDFECLQQEQTLIRHATRSNIPVLGICLGSQLVAQAAGGFVYKGKKKEIGWYDVWLTPDGRSDIFQGISTKSMKVFQWHGDTYDLPPEARIFAYSDLYPQAFRIGSAFGIQFHLEIDNNMIQEWICNYSTELNAEKISPDKILPAEGDIEALSAKCKVVYNNFIRMLESTR